ncbi:MAG TPA: class I SAM-dependent methyltransferase [Terriglobales bacterium]|nr:class I SAM-dependent methyltransferase [Terriglobales bacterium]
MNNPSVWSVLQRRWRETRARKGRTAAAREIWADVWEFVRESTPERKRLRYGDVEYDWDHQVDTTSATVSHRGRLMAALSGGPYQPTDPAEFREMLKGLAIDFGDFTFVDLGSGKGRTLLMASEFGFRRIVGVELVPELHAIAKQNIAAWSSEGHRSTQIESYCVDARDFVFPAEPLLVYLFNPLPEPALRVVIERLRKSVEAHPRELRVVYLNPILEHLLAQAGFLRRVDGSYRYAVYSN